MSVVTSQWFDEPLVITPKSRTCIQLVQITDCHLMLDGQCYEGVDSLANLERVLSDISLIKPDILVVTGDVTQDHTLASYQLLAQACDKLLSNIPVVWLPGNHDDIGDLTTAFVDYPYMFANKHVRFEGLSAGWHLLLLNSKGPTPSGLVCDDHLTQVSTLLSSLSQNDHVAAFCHHHPLPMNAYIDKHILQNGELLLQTLAEFKAVKTLAHGHVHQQRESGFANIRVLATPATSVQFKPNSKEKGNDDKGPGYRRMWLQADGRFDTEVVWLER